MQLPKGITIVKKKISLHAGFILLVLCINVMFAKAQKTDTTQKPPASMTPMPPAAMASPSPMVTPGMAGPLTANPEPLKFKSGFLGDVYVSGAVSGLLQWQNHVFPGDKNFLVDQANAQVFIQKVDGPIQFFVQAGSYSTPDIGLPYFRSGNINDSVVSGTTNLLYGVLPQAFIKIAPSANFSIMAGKLPTLIGAEYTFSFENMNIQRGLLWNQENAVNRGVQVNYKAGPVTLAASLNDGFYSNQYTWAWGSVSYAINSSNTVTLIGSGNTKITTVSSFVTPLYLNNEQLFNLIYSHISGRWTIEPYLQYTRVPKSDKLNTTQDASTLGGALFVNYAFPSKATDAGFNLPIRLEYINSTGSAAKGAPNLLYGQGSNAWSVTVTPTYQYKRFFGRAEISYVKANSITNGLAFGSDGKNSSQARLLLEIGLLF